MSEHLLSIELSRWNEGLAPCLPVSLALLGNERLLGLLCAVEKPVLVALHRPVGLVLYGRDRPDLAPS